MKTHQQLNNDIERLSTFVSLFCCEETKFIRTQCVDAMNRTSDAINSGNTRACKRAARMNAALIVQCKATEIPNEVKEWIT